MAITKVCQACDEEYEATSNVQKYCPECKKAQKKEPAKVDNGHSVKLDFSPYPQIYDEIAKVAAENFRPVGHQIMFMLVGTKKAGK